MKWIIRIGGIFMNIQRLFESKKVVYSLEVSHRKRPRRLTPFIIRFMDFAD